MTDTGGAGDGGGRTAPPEGSGPPNPAAPSLQGSLAETVRAARADGRPLPGTGGFAGALDGALVRDVLGRAPLFFEGRPEPAPDAAGEGTELPRWAHDPTELSAPRRLPAGHVHDGAGLERCWHLPAPEPVTDEAAAVRRVREAVVGAIDRLPEGSAQEAQGDLAVAFSGGVDSSLLAGGLDAPLYVVGFPDSPDVRTAREAADRLGADLHVVSLDLETLEAAVPRVVAATARTNPMDVSIALPVLLVAEAAAADGADRLVLGQGADELFGGYAKVATPASDDRIAAETVRGARREVLGTLPAQFERDCLAVRAAGVEPVTPLAHDDVVAAALSLPGDLLVGPDGTRKRALRLAARDLLPRDLADREKRAMQYGSRVSRELDRLARQAGFKRRLPDHVGQYIRDRATPPVGIGDPADDGQTD